MSFSFSRLSFVLAGTVVLFGHVTIAVHNSSLSNEALLFLEAALSNNNNSFNSFSPQLESFFKSAKLPKSVCFEHIKEVARGTLNFEEWAVSMIDAFGKPESNILRGNFKWSGSYKECLNIKNGNISGKYCWLHLILSFKMSAQMLGAIGICVPDTCDHNDIQILFQLIKKMGWSGFSGIKARASCINSPLDGLHKNGTALFAIAVCCVIFVFVIVGTILDLQSKANKINYCSQKQSNEFGIERDTKNQNFLNNILLHFSLLSNFKKLFYLETSTSTFSELNGLKVMAAMIIIYAHSFVGLFVVMNNPEESGLEFGGLLAQFTFFPVDLFFFVMGFLTLNGVLAKPFQTRGSISTFKFIVSFILPRYLKMLIVPGIIVFVSRIGLQPYLSSGPFWKVTDQNCPKNWWKNALFISNWWSMKDQCFSAWWFLSVSMQLQVIALIVIIPLIKKKYFMSVFNGCTMLISSWCWLVFDSYVKELPKLYPKKYSEVPAYRQSRDKFYNIYDKPTFHFGSYFTGMALSWVIFKHRDTIALTKRQLYLGWILSSALFYLSSYGIYLEPNNLVKSLHTAFGATMYSLSIAWLIIICNSKDGGLVSSVLRWKCWLPLSKLSLTVYLVHPTVIDTFYLSEVEQIHYSFSIFIAMLLRHLVFSYAIAILVTLMVEMPINAVIDLSIKYLFATKSRHSNKT